MTQLVDIHTFNSSNLRFSEPVVGNIPDSKLSFQRINISTVYDTKGQGDLVISTPPQIFSAGLREQISMDSGKLTGHVLPLCLWNRDGPTPEEKKFTDTISAIVDAAKTHLLENREAIGRYDLVESDLKKFDPLSWRRDNTPQGKGKIVDGTGPSLWVKVIKRHDKTTKQDVIMSMFYDEDDTPKDPLNLLQQYCLVQAAIKIESIFIGNSISLQVKLYECVHTPIQQGMQRLLARPTANPRVLSLTSPAPRKAPAIEDGEEDEDGVDDDGGSLGNASEDEDDAPPKPAPKPAPKVVKRVVKKIVKPAS
jgi:hypothetical protein